MERVRVGGVACGYMNTSYMRWVQTLVHQPRAKLVILGTQVPRGGSWPVCGQSHGSTGACDVHLLCGVWPGGCWCGGRSMEARGK